MPGYDFRPTGSESLLGIKMHRGEKDFTFGENVKYGGRVITQTSLQCTECKTYLLRQRSHAMVLLKQQTTPNHSAHFNLSHEDRFTMGLSYVWYIKLPTALGSKVCACGGRGGIFLFLYWRTNLKCEKVKGFSSHLHPSFFPNTIIQILLLIIYTF